MMSRAGIDVQLQAETMAGPHDLAALSCSESAAALAAGHPPSAAAGVRDKLVGSWYESEWKLCKPVAQLEPDDADPPIEVLEFGADRTFSVRWRAGAATVDGVRATSPDYRGT